MTKMTKVDSKTVFLFFCCLLNNENEVRQLMYESKNCVLQINAAFENMNEVEVNGSVN